MSERWLQFPGRSHVLHLINEESTGWSQDEVSGSLIACCGRTANIAAVVEPPSATQHCKMCEKVSLKQHHGE